MKLQKAAAVVWIATLITILFTGCTAEIQKGKETEKNTQSQEENKEEAVADSAPGQIEFDRLKEQNPDIFAWLYVPGAEISMPVLQSPESDDYYSTHDETGKESENGALFTEMGNLMDLCDFNTIIHGNDKIEQDPFYGLHQFENPELFNKYKQFYLYLPDNVLTYEIYTAYYDEASSILRRFDYTTAEGCEQYLKQIKTTRDLGKNVREGFEELSPYHFLVTLNGSVKEQENTQYVVIGVLVGDAAGKIDRVILD